MAEVIRMGRPVEPTWLGHLANWIVRRVEVGSPIERSLVCLHSRHPDWFSKFIDMNMDRLFYAKGVDSDGPFADFRHDGRHRRSIVWKEMEWRPEAPRTEYVRVPFPFVSLYRAVMLVRYRPDPAYCADWP
jgi:hypothetical protein